jgi:hypothetical protein
VSKRRRRVRGSRRAGVVGRLPERVGPLAAWAILPTLLRLLAATDDELEQQAGRLSPS